MTGAAANRTLHVSFRPEWDPGAADRERRGFLAVDPRVRTLLKILISYPEVRYILPDRISLDAACDPRLLETIVRFLDRQDWLVKSVALR